MVRVGQRSTADERRETVMRAAIEVFAGRGYYGTTTVEVAKAAGISQAYLYRLYPDKETLFVAVIDHCSERLREAASRAVESVSPTDPDALVAALTTSYRGTMADRNLLMVLMHGNGAAGEPEIGAAVRRCYANQVDHVRALTRASDDQVRRYFGDALLTNVILSVGADATEPWARTLLP